MEMFHYIIMIKCIIVLFAFCESHEYCCNNHFMMTVISAHTSTCDHKTKVREKMGFLRGILITE